MEHLFNTDHCSDWEIVNLQFPGSRDDKKGVWLIGTFVARVWEEIFVKNVQRLKKEQFFGFLKFKYKMDLQMEMPLGVFPGFPV